MAQPMNSWLRYALSIMCAVSITAQCCKAQGPANAADTGNTSTRDPMAPAPDSAEGVKRLESTELDLPEDDSIKLKVEPLIVGSVVDRVAEPSTIAVECPGALTAEVYIVPVDA